MKIFAAGCLAALIGRILYCTFDVTGLLQIVVNLGGVAAMLGLAGFLDHRARTVPHGTLITGRQLGCGRRRLQRINEQNALRAWPSLIGRLRQQMPEVGPEPDHEIERDQRKHARLEYAVSSIVWTARGGVQQPGLPPLPRWRERANDLQGHSPATQHRR
ncbi:hypothetical protein ABIE45_001300 [Methylobacterium sp. OAE515]